MTMTVNATLSPQVMMPVQGVKGEKVTKPQTKILFERIPLLKTEEASADFSGSIAITEDNNHKGWLHILIYIGQLFNAILTGKKRDKMNLCHSQIILGINESQGKKGELLLAHGLFSGIKTTSENHKKDEVITGMYIYRPVDEKMRNLFKKYAEQTAVNFKKAGLVDPKKPDFKSRVKKEVGQFSIISMIASAFHRQVVKPYEDVQKRAAYAAADLLKGDKLRDEKGNLASYFCTGYVMTLTQGTSLISALTEEEEARLKEMSREEIAQYILERIKKHEDGDDLADIYWNNKFMQVDARFTMSYMAGEVLDEASVFKVNTSPAAA